MPGETEVEFDMDGALEEISSSFNMGNSDGTDRNSANDLGSVDDSPADRTGSGDTPGTEGLGEGAADGEHSSLGALNSSDGTGLTEHTTPPTTWRKEAAELWANLDPRVRAEIHKREADIFRGLETYKSDATFAKGIQSALAPYKHLIDQYQIDPVKQIGGLVNAHYSLATATPERRAEMFRQLAKDYGVSLDPPVDPENAPFVDPQVKALQDEIRALQSRLNAEDSRRLSAVKADTEREVAAFAADKANPYFDEVANDIAQLLQSGVAKSLKEAYDKAVWANPITRQKEVERIAAEKAAKAIESKAKHAANARQATAANVRTSAKTGSGTAPLGTMDDTLQQTLAAINSRAA